MSKKVLIAGESWMSHTTHVKGFDSFTTSVYEEGIKWLRDALEGGGYEVTFLPNHIAGEAFPYTVEELNEYDAVILSDIGANTLLLPTDTFMRSQARPNRLNVIADYVQEGGSLCMVGGYLTFMGIDAKGQYNHTAVAEILPVAMFDRDDRMENPQGVIPVIESDHEIFNGIPKEWPAFLGYNQTQAIVEGQVLATVNGDPFVAIREVGKGKTSVFTSDCSPHWAPPEFVNWEHYKTFWVNMMDWMCK